MSDYKHFKLSDLKPIQKSAFCAPREQLIFKSGWLVGVAELECFVNLNCGPLSLGANTKALWHAKHKVIVGLCCEEPLHLWLHWKDEGVIATYVLARVWHLRTSIHKSTKNFVVLVTNQYQAGVVTIWVLIRSFVKLIQVVAVFTCLEDELRISNSHVGRHHHPKVSVRLVVNEWGLDRGIRHVVNHICYLARPYLLTHHCSHLLLTELVPFCSPKRIIEGQTHKLVVLIRHQLNWMHSESNLKSRLII